MWTFSRVEKRLRFAKETRNSEDGRMMETKGRLCPRARCIDDEMTNARQTCAGESLVNESFESSPSFSRSSPQSSVPAPEGSNPSPCILFPACKLFHTSANPPGPTCCWRRRAEKCLENSFVTQTRSPTFVYRASSSQIHTLYFS